MEVATRTLEEAEVLERINKGEHGPQDLDALRAMLAKNGKNLRRAADLCDLAFRTAKELMGNDSPLLTELMEDRRQLMRSELGYEDSPLIERLIIDEIILCWLRHYQAQYKHMQIEQGGMTLEQGKYWEKRVAATQRRLLRSIESLARVRKVLKSVNVQVNVSEQQINLADARRL